MNQRIQKLIEQATQSAMWPGDPDAGELDAEKFAELIIRECANVARDNTPDTEECQYTHLVSEAIKRHFGIEE